jgi:AbrB family looped-hinge helix DNA binding protein
MGSSKVTKFRITVVKDVADEMGLKDGDHIMFFKDKNGQFIIKKG